MARTVADVALMLSVMAGPDPRGRRSRSRSRAPVRAGRSTAISRGCGWPGRPTRRAAGGSGGPRRSLEARRRSSRGSAATSRRPPGPIGGRRGLPHAARLRMFEVAVGPLLDGHRDGLKPDAIWERGGGPRLTGPEVARARGAARPPLPPGPRRSSSATTCSCCRSTRCRRSTSASPTRPRSTGVPMEDYLDWMRSAYWSPSRAAGDVRPGRVHARRAAGRHPDRRAAPGETSPSSRSPTPSSRPPGTGGGARRRSGQSGSGARNGTSWTIPASAHSDSARSG